MTYLVSNPNTGQQFEIEDLNEARTKLAEIKVAVLVSEDYRFTVAKETVNGNDTTWSNADLDNDPEDYTYHVFNTFTGQHELLSSLSLAKARYLELKEQFATELGLNGEPQLKPVDEPVVRNNNEYGEIPKVTL
jgi:hypothetical protein